MKKLLALVLALVMVMGLSVVSANAAIAKEFTDDSKIQYKEAVGVMSGIGVIDGRTDGSFEPEGTLTRAQAAKIVAYMLKGKTQADALTASSAPFDDVPKDHWAAGAIAFCQSEGIIAGKGNNKFDPDGKLTGHQFAKMLLVALGYDSETEGFVGEGWEMNVAKLAQNAGLTDDLAIVLSNEISRDQACMMSFNTLTAAIVDYTAAAKVTTSDGTKVEAGNNRYNPDLLDNGYTVARNGANNNDDDLFCEKYFKDLKKQIAVDDDGNPADQWVLKGKEIGTYAKEEQQQFTGEVAIKDLYGAIGSAAAGNISAVGGVATVTYFVDGEDVSGADGAALAAAIAAGKTDSTALNATGTTTPNRVTGNGTITKVYAEWNANAAKVGGGTGAFDITVTVTHVFVGKVSTVTEASGNAARKITISPKTTVNSFNNAGDVIKAAGIVGDYDYETEGFAKNDIVLFTVKVNAGASTITSVMPTTEVTNASVTGSKTASNPKNDTVTAGGTEYKFNLCHKDDSAISVGDALNLYLDENGFVVWTELYQENLDLSKYLVLTRGAMGSGLADTPIAHAVTLDGKNLNEITIAKVDGKSVTQWDDDIAGSASGSCLTLFNVYKFKTNASGAYELSFVDNPYDDLRNDTSTFVYNTGAATLDFGAAGTAIGTASTKFFVYDVTNKSVKEYTGIKNVPEIDATAAVNDFDASVGAGVYDLTGDGTTKDWGGENLAAAALTKDGTAIAVVLVTGDVASTTNTSVSADDIIYVLSDTYTTSKSGDDTVYSFDAIVKGKVSTISMTSAGARDTIYEPNGGAGKGMYVVSQYDGEYVDTIKLEPPAGEKLSLVAGADGHSVEGSATTFSAMMDCKTTNAEVKVTANTITFKFSATDVYAVALDTACKIYEISKNGTVTEITDTAALEADVSKCIYWFLLDRDTNNVDTAKALYVQKT